MSFFLPSRSDTPASSTPPLFPLLGEQQMTRRSFVLGTASFAAAALLSTRARGAVATAPKFTAYPFSLGVASGDPLPDGVVLWTRLAPKPLEIGSGMTPEPVEVSWQIAEDEAMARVVKGGTVTATADWSHSVHVEVEGLRPDRWYWYQFKAGSEVSPKGRTRTAPPVDAAPDRLRFAFASCQHYEAGLFPAYKHMAKEDLDLVVHLGDYIYEGAAQPAGAKAKEKAAGAIRHHLGGECQKLDDYRLRYSLYKTDPALQAAHAMAPWIVTWDDHEVTNNYANDFSGSKKQPRDEFLLRRAAAYQAYFENMPLRRTALPKGPDMLLYRGLSFGRLARFHVLDTRQYRTPQPQGDGNKPPSPVLMDPKGTLMGDKQREWFFNGLTQSPSAWNVVAQQIMVARVDKTAGPDVTYSMDQWPGYEFERRRMLKHFHDAKIKNPVVITGDIHTNWANELIADFDQLDSKVVATEFVGTSITSGGNGSTAEKRAAEFIAENPFVKFFNAERGYVTCEITPKQWRTDYKTVENVSSLDAKLNTRAKFVVESGNPKLQKA